MLILVLDSCMGSGTTAEASVRTERHYIGFETDPARCDAANRRAESARSPSKSRSRQALL